MSVSGTEENAGSFLLLLRPGHRLMIFFQLLSLQERASFLNLFHLGKTFLREGRKEAEQVFRKVGQVILVLSPLGVTEQAISVFDPRRDYNGNLASAQVHLAEIIHHTTPEEVISLLSEASKYHTFPFNFPSGDYQVG